MRVLSYTPNQTVRLFQVTYVIQSVEDSVLTLRESTTGITRTFELSTLLKHYAAGNLMAPAVAGATGLKRPERRVVHKRVLSDASSAAQRRAQIQREYLQAIGESGVPWHATESLTEVAEEVTKRLGLAAPPSIRSLRRWRQRLLGTGGDMIALIPHFERRGAPGRPRFPDSVIELMNRVIDNVYLSIEARPMTEAYEELVARLEEKRAWCADGDLPTPSYSSFRRAIMSRGGYELIAARHGKRAAERAYRSSGRSTEIYGFNQCWEMDHTTLDLMLVDATGLIAKRPRFTAIVEYSTRALMGFDIDFSGTSSQAVLNCLRHAITPKGYVAERYPRIKGSWPCHGVPEVLKVDNGPEFHSHSVRQASFELGIELQYCPVKMPWYKGRVERFFRTMSEGFLSSLPGAARPDRQRRKDIEDFNLPVLDLKTFDELFHNWLVDVYMADARGNGS